jgi:hypothetical protein
MRASPRPPATCSVEHLARNARYYRYENKITDYNFGSLIRTDATREYSETNTIFGALVFFSWMGIILLLIGHARTCGRRYHSNANTGELPFPLLRLIMPS